MTGSVTLHRIDAPRMDYWEDSGLVAFGVTTSAVGISLAATGFLWGIALLTLGVFLATLALFSGVETAVRAGQRQGNGESGLSDSSDSPASTE